MGLDLLLFHGHEDHNGDVYRSFVSGLDNRRPTCRLLPVFPLCLLALALGFPAPIAGAAFAPRDSDGYQWPLLRNAGAPCSSPRIASAAVLAPTPHTTLLPSPPHASINALEAIPTSHTASTTSPPPAAVASHGTHRRYRRCCRLLSRFVILSSIRRHCIPASAPCDRPWSLSPTPVRRRPPSQPASPTLYGDTHTRIRRRLLVRPALATAPHLDRAPPVTLVCRSSCRLSMPPSPIATAISVTPGPQVRRAQATAKFVPFLALSTHATAARGQLRYTTPTRRFRNTTIHRERTRMKLETFVFTQYLPSPSPSPRLLSFRSNDLMPFQIDPTSLLLPFII
ncbi:hypothetical protein K438DRAFT_1983731 [Mycena galopus ATCC 62051]|nr:hypothetical protein K438DRAFT_1983731 [Mycena galopus ATCC 62051]